MSQWELDPPHEPPALSREQAIQIALFDSLTSTELRSLPVGADYGSLRRLAHARRFQDRYPDVWKVAVDVSSLGWDMAYEGPGATMVDGERYVPNHLRVPKVRAVIIIIDDKMGQRVVSGTEAEPGQEHRIEWHKAP